jgi:hypothetical protein
MIRVPPALNRAGEWREGVAVGSGRSGHRGKYETERARAIGPVRRFAVEFFGAMHRQKP